MPRYELPEVAKALNYRSKGRSMYNQIRKDKNIHLMGPTQLRNWLKKFKCEPGYQEDNLFIAEQMMKNSKCSDFCIAGLTFDEMDLRKNRIEFDQRTETMYGPCKKVQMVMMRGLPQK